MGPPEWAIVRKSLWGNSAIAPGGLDGDIFTLNDGDLGDCIPAFVRAKSLVFKEWREIPNVGVISIKFPVFCDSLGGRIPVSFRVLGVPLAEGGRLVA